MIPGHAVPTEEDTEHSDSAEQIAKRDGLPGEGPVQPFGQHRNQEPHHHDGAPDRTDNDPLRHNGLCHVGVTFPGGVLVTPSETANADISRSVPVTPENAVEK